MNSFKKYISVLVVCILCLQQHMILADTDASFRKTEKLNEKIIRMRDQLGAKENISRKDIQELLRLHEKRMKLNPLSQLFKWECISDDLNWGTWGHAVYLLMNAEDDRSRMKLIELNYALSNQGRTVELVPFDKNWLKKTFGGSEDYVILNRSRIPYIASKINRKYLTAEENERLDVYLGQAEATPEIIRRNTIIPVQQSEAKLNQPISVEQTAMENTGEPEIMEENSIPADTQEDVPVRTSEHVSAENQHDTLQAPDAQDSQEPKRPDLSSQIEEAARLAELEADVLRESADDLAEMLSREEEMKQTDDLNQSTPEEEHKKKNLNEALFSASGGIEAREDNSYYWKIIKNIGDVSVQKSESGHWYTPKPEEKIFEGYQIKTGENASVLMLIRGVDNEESYTQLFQNSQLKVINLAQSDLEKLDDVYLELLTGEVLVNIEGLSQESSFKVKTPTAVAGVRGTAFNIAVLMNAVTRLFETRFMVLKGVLGITRHDISAAAREIGLAEGETLKEDSLMPGVPTQGDRRAMRAYKKQVATLTRAVIEKKLSTIQLETRFQNETSLGEVPAIDPNLVPGDSKYDETGETPVTSQLQNIDCVADPLNPLCAENIGNIEITKQDLLRQSLGNLSVEEKQLLQIIINDNPLLKSDPLFGSLIDPTLQTESFFESFGFGDLPPPVNPAGFSGDEFGFGRADGVIFVNNSEGSNVNSGATPETAVLTLEKAMEIAFQNFKSSDLLVILIKETGKDYPVPSDGLLLRPRTAIASMDINGDRPVINGKGNGDFVFKAKNGINAFFNVRITNDNSGGGIKTENASISFDRVEIQNVSVGLSISGVGPQFPRFSDDDNIEEGNEQESGILIRNSLFKDISGVSILFPVTGLPGVCDVFDSEFDNAGVVLRGASNGSTAGNGVDCIWENVDINNCKPSGTSVISITGDRAHCDFFRVNLKNCSQLGTSSPLIQTSGSDSEMTWRGAIIKGNTLGVGQAFIDAGSSFLLMENCIVAGNSMPAAASVVKGGGSKYDLMFVNNTFYGNAQFRCLDVVISGSNLLRAVNNIMAGFQRPIDANGTNTGSIQLLHNLFTDISYNSGGTYVYNTNLGDFDLNGSTNDINLASASFSNAGGFATGGNTEGDPLLKADYTPDANNDSPAVDAGFATGGNFATMGGDVYGQPRVINVNGGSAPYNDIGAVEAQSGSDPLISGRIYNSINNEIIEGAVVALYEAGTNQPLATTTGGLFSFDVLPGNYYITVSRDGFFFPSTRSNFLPKNAHGFQFTVLDGIDQVIDIPLDPTAFVFINKSANKKSVTPGEILTVNVNISNTYWYNEIRDIYLEDMIPQGFKLVKGSVRRNGIAVGDAVHKGTSLEFSIASLAALENINLSYQIVPSVGLASGTYRSSAIIRQTSDQVPMSNTSSVDIQVYQDSLFTNGTVVGRVFHDENENGIYDPGEKGIKDTRIATEYGLYISPDEFGLFHIKNIFSGRHVLKIDPGSLPEGYKPMHDHGASFEVFEGGITKVNLPVIKGLKEENSFFIVSLAEVSLQDQQLSGAIELVEKDSQFDENLSVDGRGAFFLRGKIKGKYLLTMSYDSERLSGKQKEFYRNQLFTNLNPDEYYPIYGDGSATDYSFINTDTALFVLLEWDRSKAGWGSFEIDWPLFRKIYQGGYAVLKSSQKTRFEQDKINLEGYVASSKYRTTREEFSGTGTSLYHLRQTPIIQGSEKVLVEFRNRYNSTAYESIQLVEELDYTINYATGRLILKRPLTSTIRNYSQSIVSNDILAGAQGILIVEYEYEAIGKLDRDAYGGKGKVAITDHLTVEASYNEEERTADPYTLASGTIAYQFNKDSVISGTYSRSEETFSGGGLSFDGGIGRQQAVVSSVHKVGQEGDSWNVSLKAILFDDLSLQSSYSETDAGFSARGSFSFSDTSQFLSDLIYKLNDAMTLGLQYLESESRSEDIVVQTRQVVSTFERTNLYFNYEKDFWDTRLEYTYQDYGMVHSGRRFFGSLPPRGEQLIALKAGVKAWEQIYIYGILQGTLKENADDSLSNDMATLGITMPFLDQIDLSLEGRTGDIGHSVITSFIYNESAEIQSHVGFETGTHAYEGKFQNVSFSRSMRDLNGNVFRFYKDYNYLNHRIVNGDVFEADIPLNDRWSIGFAYETSGVDEEDESTAVTREVVAFRYNYLIPSVFKLFGKAEWRQDEDGLDQITTEHYFFEDELLWHFNEDFHIRLKCALGFAEDEGSDERAFDYREGSVGFSYRPKYTDRWHILGKYTYMDDEPLDLRSRFVEDSQQKKNVLSIDAVADVITNLQLVQKLAFRQMQEKVGQRDWQESDTYLWITGLNWKITANWLMGIEYRVMENETFKDQKTGYLVQVGYDMNDMMRFVLGYNFTDFDDNLVNRDNYDRSGTFIRFEGRY